MLFIIVYFSLLWSLIVLPFSVSSYKTSLMLPTESYASSLKRISQPYSLSVQHLVLSKSLSHLFFVAIEIENMDLIAVEYIEVQVLVRWSAHWDKDNKAEQQKNKSFRIMAQSVTWPWKRHNTQGNITRWHSPLAHITVSCPPLFLLSSQPSVRQPSAYLFLRPIECLTLSLLHAETKVRLRSQALH